MSIRHIRTILLGATFIAVLSACGQNGNEQQTSSEPAATEAAAPAAAACDTACLESALDSYLQALVTHDASMAPVADSVRYTENGQTLEVGDGLWATASDLPTNYKLTIPDPTMGEIAYHIVMKEHGDPIWLAGRLKVENQKITEIEDIVIRQGGGFGNFDRTPDPRWAVVLDDSQKAPRDKMADIANMYFDALQDNKADYLPFAHDCGRVENGVVTANNPDAKPVEGRPNIGSLSCAGNINSMMWRYITNINQRRTVAIDEEHGVVSAVVMFNHAGNVDSTVIPGFGEYKYTGAAHRPFSALVLESFKVVDGKVQQIAATLITIPYGSKTGWE